MEIIVWSIIIGIAVWAILKNRKKQSMLEEERIDELLQTTLFQVKILQTKEEKLDLDCFRVEIKGTIKALMDNQAVKFIAKMYDETDGKKEPVLSNIKEFQSDDSSVFSFLKKQTLPYADSIISDWIPAFFVPLVFLEFPKKGNRNISIVFYVVNQADKILEKASDKISFFNKENGYLNAIENRQKFEEVMIKIALLVSKSDNQMVSAEADVIKHWVNERLLGYNSDIKDEHKQRFNSYIKEGYSQVKNAEIDIHSTLDEINEIASVGEKYQLYELCLKVISADSKAEQEELDMLDGITDYLNLDRVKLQSILDEGLIGIDIKPVSKKELLVGVRSNMDKEQIKKHLLKEYSKWNARVAHNDKKIRERAKEMKEIIVELREKYK